MNDRHGAFDAIRGAPSSSGATHDTRDVEALIARARQHRLGVDFLLGGAHDAVAVTFGVHAFLVDAARDHLQAKGHSPGTRSPSPR